MKTNILRWSSLYAVVFTIVSAPLAQTAQEATTKSPIGNRFPTYEAPGKPGQVQEPVDELRLRDALALALMHNPNLASFSWGVRASEAAQLQAGAWPNPELGFEYEDFGGGGELEGTDAAEATLSLSQLVLLGGKRSKRTELARLDNANSNWDYETQRISTYAATVAAFVKVLAAQERLALANKIVDVAEDIAAAVSARVNAGGTLALEENRARVAVESSLIAKLLSERELTIARRDLAATWGGNTPRFTEAIGDLESVSDQLPILDDLLTRIDQNPEVARWTTELERRRARVNLIKADRMPDLNITGGVRHHNAVDEVAFLFALSVPLPTWDRKAEAIREAEYLVSQATPARHATTVRIQQDITNTYEVLSGAYDEVTRLRDRVLPEAEKAVTGSGNAYRAGALQLTDVLDIQRTFFRLRIRYVDALARYHGAVAELEGLVGEPIAGVSGSISGTEGE